MTAINYGNKRGKVIAREARSAPKAYLYRIQLEDGSTTTVVERTNVPEKHINDEWIVNVFDDPNFNVFIRRL